MTDLTREEQALLDSLRTGRSTSGLDCDEQAILTSLTQDRDRTADGLTPDERAIRARFLLAGQRRPGRPGWRAGGPRPPRPAAGTLLRPVIRPARDRDEPPRPMPSAMARLLLRSPNASEGLGPQGAEIQAGQWTDHGFTIDDVGFWLKAGLRTDDWRHAVQLRDVGITPALTAVAVRPGESVIDRLRDGATPEDLRRLLIRHGHIIDTLPSF